MAETHSNQEALQRGRIVLLMGVMGTMTIYLILRLAGWQLFPHPEYIEYGAERVNTPEEIPAVRGGILDATGNHLVISTYGCRIYLFVPALERVDPMDKKGEIQWGQTQKIARIAEVLDKPVESVARIAAVPPRDLRKIIAASVPPEICQELEPLRDKGVQIEYGYWRVYPDEALAAHVLGFVDLDGNGQYGLEGYYDRELRGQNGLWQGIRGPWGQPVMAVLGGYRPPQPGADLVLTLDRNIQYEAERILAEGILTNKATSGNIIVLDARTGAILAMANFPTYDPAEYWYVDSIEEHRNRCISAVYEPGSVLKSITLAAALEMQVIRATDTYDDRGSIIVGEQEIKNWDKKAHGITTMTQLLAYSLNVGAAHVASLLGPTRFYEMFKRFGFGEHTQIDLIGEERGLMRVPGDPYWHMSDLGRNAYGQGIAVTPLQVAVAYGVLANGGLMMKPYIVSEIRTPEGTVRTNPTPLRQVISPDTAAQMTLLLEEAVKLGMRPAMVPGYRIAGKSGTASIPTPEGYEGKDVIASFVGYGPLPDPRYVILVKFDKPREGEWAAEVAEPEFSRLFAFLMDYVGIPPTP